MSEILNKSIKSGNIDNSNRREFICNIKDKNEETNTNTYTFTVETSNVCFVNAIRRTILTDIPTIVFKCFPYEETNVDFIKNTTKYNNEVLKERLQLIPIHLKNISEEELQDMLMEVNVKNETDTILLVSTEHFKIKRKSSGEYFPDEFTRQVFKPFRERYFIQFLYLQPKITEDIDGEHIHITCDFKLETAKQDASFNVVGTCSYGNTIDEVGIEKQLIEMRKKWSEQNLNEENEEKNWRLLEAKRIYILNSFDFILQSIGVYTNIELLVIACDILINKAQLIISSIDNDTIDIHTAESTILNCYDIILKNEDYTIGNMLQYILFKKFYKSKLELSYCGFTKEHPHDLDSVIRLAYYKTVDIPKIKLHIKTACESIIEFYEYFKEHI